MKMHTDIIKTCFIFDVLGVCGTVSAALGPKSLNTLEINEDNEIFNNSSRLTDTYSNTKLQKTVQGPPILTLLSVKVSD